MKKFALVIYLYTLSISSLFAATVYLERSNQGRPAEDLIYQGRLLNSHQLVDLRRQGVDLSTLNPRKNLLWENKKLGSNISVLNHAQANFHSYLASTKGLFRSSIDILEAGSSAPMTLTISLSNHGALLRSTLLRKLGYFLQPLQYVKELTLHFSNVEAKNSFLDAMSDRSLTSRKRWIVNNDKTSSSVTLRDVVLEQGRIEVHPLHWGVISDAALRNRRIFRSLIVPFVLGDFYENVNLFNWRIGHLFNDAVTLNYFLAESFHQTTYDDARWITRRIARLSLSDWEEVIAGANLPYDVSQLLMQKMISRRNALVHYFQIEQIELPVDDQITIGHVQRGKLLKKNYDGYALDFATDDPDNPLRLSEMARYFTIDGLNMAIQEALKRVNQYLQLATVGDAINGHREDIFNSYMDHLKKYGPTVPFKLPVKQWGSPIAGLNLSTGRSVVSGTYYGSDAPIQLVDNLGVQVNVGMFGGIDGTGVAMTTDMAGVSVSRNYMHLKPVSSIKEGLKTNWKNLFVSGYMKKLGRIISRNYKCSIPKQVWVEQVTIQNILYHKISYDRSSSVQKQEALKVRKQLLADGIPLSSIMLNPINRKVLCDEELETQLDEDIKKLVKEMTTGEMIIVSDGLGINLSVNTSLPLSLFLGGVKGGTVSLGAGALFALTKRTMIVKTEEGIQVYIQRLRSKQLQESVDLNYLISLLNVKKSQLFGKAKTKFFSIDFEKDQGRTTADFLMGLKSILRHNNTERLEKDLSFYLLNHSVRGKTTNIKMLLKKWDFLRQEHLLDITPPESESYINTDFTRKLYEVKKIKRSGFRLFGFLSDIFRWATGGISVSRREGENPGSSLWGKAHWTTLSTEVELTPDSPDNPVTIFEDVYNGWSTSRKKIIKLLKKSEKRFLANTKQAIDYSKLNSTKRVLLYEIRSTLILYPSFIKDLLHALQQGKVKAFEKLVALYGGEKRLREYCERRDAFEDDDSDSFSDWNDLSFLPHRHRLKDTCLPDWMDSIFRLQRKFRKKHSRQQQAMLANKVIERILKVETPAELTKNLDQDSYFIVTKLNGFRTHDSAGDISYLSDTVGHYSNDLGAGIFKTISSQVGISSYELYAKYFSQGF